MTVNWVSKVGSGIDKIKYTPDPGHHMGKWQNTKKHHIQESQEVSPFPAGDHKAAMNRQININKVYSTPSPLGIMQTYPILKYNLSCVK